MHRFSKLFGRFSRHFSNSSVNFERLQRIESPKLHPLWYTLPVGYIASQAYYLLGLTDDERLKEAVELSQHPLLGGEGYEYIDAVSSEECARPLLMENGQVLDLLIKGSLSSNLDQRKTCLSSIYDLISRESAAEAVARDGKIVDDMLQLLRDPNTHPNDLSFALDFISRLARIERTHRWLATPEMFSVIKKYLESDVEQWKLLAAVTFSTFSANPDTHSQLDQSSITTSMGSLEESMSGKETRFLPQSLGQFFMAGNDLFHHTPSFVSLYMHNLGIQPAPNVIRQKLCLLPGGMDKNRNGLTSPSFLVRENFMIESFFDCFAMTFCSAVYCGARWTIEYKKCGLTGRALWRKVGWKTDSAGMCFMLMHTWPTFVDMMKDKHTPGDPSVGLSILTKIVREAPPILLGMYALKNSRYVAFPIAMAIAFKANWIEGLSGDDQEEQQ